jgi:opacity protein-like surface antigen
MLNTISQFMKTVVSLSLVIMLFSASPSYAKAPSNEELHQMILGMKDKLDKLEIENKGLKNQLGVALNKIEGKTYASLSPQHTYGIRPSSAHREPSPIHAVLRNERQVPQVATNGEKVEEAKRTQTDQKPADSDVYARVSIAYSAPEDISAEDQNGSSGIVSLSKKIGFEAAVGKRISNNWRGEFEISHRNFDPISATGLSGNVKKVTVKPAGDVDLYAANFNGYYSFPIFHDMSPYIGAGIGLAYLKGNDLTTAAFVGDTNLANRQEPYSNHFWLPAGNVSAGFTLPLSRRWDVDFGYKFALFGDLSGSRGKNSANSSVLKIHNLNGGLRYNF